MYERVSVQLRCRFKVPPIPSIARRGHPPGDAKNVRNSRLSQKSAALSGLLWLLSLCAKRRAWMAFVGPSDREPIVLAAPFPSRPSHISVETGAAANRNAGGRRVFTVGWQRPCGREWHCPCPRGSSSQRPDDHSRADRLRRAMLFVPFGPWPAHVMQLWPIGIKQPPAQFPPRVAKGWKERRPIGRFY